MEMLLNRKEVRLEYISIVTLLLNSLYHMATVLLVHFNNDNTCNMLLSTTVRIRFLPICHT